MYRLECWLNSDYGFTYSDFIVYDDLRTLYAVSYSGYLGSCKTMAKACQKERSIMRSWSAYGTKSRYSPRGPFRLYTNKLNDIYHYVLISEAAWAKDGTRLLIAWDGDVIKSFEALLKNNYSIPFDKDWVLYLLLRCSEEGYVEPLEIDTVNPNLQEARAFRVFMSDNDLANLIQREIEQGNLKVVDNPDQDKIAQLEQIESLTDYVTTYSHLMGDKIAEILNPRHKPGVDPLDPLIETLGKTPYRAQADVVQGAVKTLEKRKSVIVVGEMGSGKTIIGAAIPYVASNNKPFRALVMCPGHLTDKWERELKDTIPGALVTQLDSYKAVLALRNADAPIGPEYYIISRDRAKLGYNLRHGARWHERTETWRCPDCGGIQQFRYSSGRRRSLIYGRDHFDKPKVKNAKCTECGTPLWQADKDGFDRCAPASLIKKYLKGFFDYFIADEVHELKGQSAQGEAFGMLAASCKKTIALTGTLLGGYASDIFYILHRLSPQTMKNDGFNYSDLSQWVQRYGILESTINLEDETLNTSSRASRSQTKTRARPGISPLVFANHLLGNCIFLELGDLVDNLPPYTESVHLVPMTPEQRRGYTELSRDLKRAVGRAIQSGSNNMLGTYLMNLLAYPDRPFDNEPILNKEEQVVATPLELDPGEILPKEEKLLEIVARERQQGRKVMVYCTFTQRKDVQGRLKTILQREGYKADILHSSVKPADREKWIAQRVKQGYDVIICNARLVETGLDLFDFPTLVFYQTGYNLFTLRQASRRSWRIGQTKPVRVEFLAYSDTMQETALQLMGTRLEAAMAIEGKFSEEGLRALSEGIDMTTALAKALVDGISRADSVEAIWARMQGRGGSESANIVVEAAEAEEAPVAVQAILKMITQEDIDALPKKVRSHYVPGQLSFDFDAMLEAEAS